jgi:hypothetical protein
MKTFALGILKGRNPRQEREIQIARVTKEKPVPEREAKKAKSANATTPVTPEMPLIPSIKL